MADVKSILSKTFVKKPFMTDAFFKAFEDELEKVYLRIDKYKDGKFEWSESYEDGFVFDGERYFYEIRLDKTSTMRFGYDAGDRYLTPPSYPEYDDEVDVVVFAIYSDDE